MTAADAAPSKAAFSVEDTVEEDTLPEGTTPPPGLDDDDTLAGEEPVLEPEEG